MTAKSCKATVLSQVVNVLIVDGNHHNVSQSAYTGEMDNKHVLTIHLLVVILTVRHRDFIKHAGTGQALNLQRGHNGRHHRHNVSHGRTVTN